MKKFVTLMMTASLLMLFSFSSFAQKNDFTGKWMLDRTKSTPAENSPILVRLTVQVKADSLLTERVYDIGDGSEYPFTENVACNGNEVKSTIYEMPRSIKATWSEPDKAFLVETTTTFNGQNGTENFVSKETWKADKGAKTLTISFKNTTSAGNSEGAFIFTRAE